jgi:glycosyltransferase involved in cell wall biosynthesis
MSVRVSPREVSAVVLCYRAGASVMAVVDPLRDVLDRSGVTYELVLVANYWPQDPDDTPEIVRRFAATHDNVKVIDRVKEGGMGWDMRTGLAAAAGAYLIVIDGDAQNPVEDVVRMHELLRRSGADIGKGRRTNRADGIYRRLISWGFNLLFRLLFRTRGLWDINGKPKALTRDAYERLSLESNDWFIDAEIVLAGRRAGMNIVELPVVFLENKERSSFVRFSSILQFSVHMVRYRVRGRP